MAGRIPRLLITMAAVWGARPVQATPLEVVRDVDLNRYVGRWYEIARLPNRFQRACQADVTATYTLRQDGKITVVNECRQADGRIKSARGTARLVDPKASKAKLKVSFFWPFSGNYWIIGLDPQYRWAVVGEPGRDYLWILSREPHMDEALYGRILDQIRKQGYDTGKLRKTAQHS